MPGFVVLNDLPKSELWIESSTRMVVYKLAALKDKCTIKSVIS